ncbi:hypothetical protein SY88_01500 [Clostridiales bacterium PH28_bin88]|nr:hypothetical protein SY88_01500 [Clostridiales bacterium PH28_bin88]
MNIKLVFNLKLLSDYHTSAGFGLAHGVDSALLRDRHGLPSVRGSSLAGLFRSAARELKLFFPDAEMAGTLLDRVFGSARHPAAWAFGSASLAQAVALARSSGGRRFARDRRGVSIDPQARRAQDKKLWAREFGGANLEFRFTVEHVGSRGEERDEAALLVAAARLVRGLGSTVNRGAGRCLISLVRVEGTVEAVSQEDLLRHFAALVRGEDRPGEFQRGNAAPPGARPEHARMLVIAQAVEPVIISWGGHSGNAYQTVPYIPGAALLGAFAGKYAYLRPVAGDHYDTFLALFRRGQVRFGPLYPVKETGSGWQLVPSIPVPRDILTCKHKPFYSDDAHRVRLRGYAAAEEIPGECEICGSGVPLVDAQGFLTVDAWGAPTSLRPATEFHTHVKMVTDERRADEKALYSYEALAAGQYFVGEMTFAGATAMQALLEVCDRRGDGYETEIRLGKGTKRGYGRLRLWLQPTGESCLNPVPVKRRVNFTGAITMTFLSDAILLDPWGRTVSDLTSEALSACLGLEVETLNSFVSTREIDGFSAVTGLPRFRDLAIRAGSTVGFKVKQKIGLSELQLLLERWETDGLGLRQHEGFGRVAFNHVVYDMQNFAGEIRPILIPGHWQAGAPVKSAWERLEAILWQRFHHIDMTINPKVRERCREVARWLHAHAHLGIDELAGRVQGLGELDILKDFGIKPRRKPNLVTEFGQFRRELADRVQELYRVLEQEIDAVARHPGEAAALRREMWPLCLEWFGGRLVAGAERGEKHE